MRGRFAFTAAVTLLSIAACSSAPAGPSGSPGNKPSVVIQSPANGAVVAVGENVTVAGAATYAGGVDHVALFADGVSFASTPAGQPAPLVPFSLSWLATPAGPHLLQVIAYGADGTTSDPGVINVVVGASGSGLPLGSGASLPAFSFPVAGQPGPPATPKPTKKPKPSTAPTTQPTTPPTTTPTTTTATATPTTPPATPTPTVLPTPASDGTAPDDTATEPHYIDVEPSTTNCPADPNGPPVSAVGCVWEQISAPAGDSTDSLEFKLFANTAYQLYMTSCSDVSGQTAWGVVGDTGDPLTGCLGWIPYDTLAAPPATATIAVTFATAPVQIYNLYQFTVYQCQFANCGNQ
jgi:Bacterial Ig domain